jgi:hypothetical protein
MTEKKVVRVEGTDDGQDAPEWKPKASAESKALRFRLIAFALWPAAIAGEVYAIVGVLNKPPVNMPLLIGLIVGIGVLAIIGSVLWKKANRLDPAHKSDTVRFFVQNQLGAIMTLLAFLPLIVLVFLNKDMNGRQKALAGGVGIVVALVATYIGIDWNPPSVEQYTAETNQVTQATGQDLVYWTKAGKVFHLCENASAVNLESKDNTIYSGSVADAHAAGKDRLTLQVEQERKQCGFATNEDVPGEAAPAEDAPADQLTP